MTSDRGLEAYRVAHRQIVALLAAANDSTAAMASVVAVLFEHLPAVSWAGFYRVVESDLLRIGPYQGPVGCQEISFGKGVCGAAAQERRTLLVPDVHAFPGHIACDDRSRSEIVVPIFDSTGALAAVLDLDSHELDRFDELDRSNLEQIGELLRDCFPAHTPPATIAARRPESAPVEPRDQTPSIPNRRTR